MNFDDSFHKRVSIARNSVGLTQAELARKVGVVPRQIAAYEGNEAKPREKALQNLAAALGTTVSWLSNGSGEGPDVSNIKRTITVREIPLLSHIEAKSRNIDKILSESSVRDFIPAPPDAGELSFALEVQGDSMKSSHGTSFPDGTIIIIDPMRSLSSGDFALFLDSDSEHTLFKQFVIDQSKAYLRSLNPIYPILPATNKYISIGKVISAQQPLGEKSSALSAQADVSREFREQASKSLDERLAVIEKKIDAIMDILNSNKKPT